MRPLLSGLLVAVAIFGTPQAKPIDALSVSKIVKTITVIPGCKAPKVNGIIPDKTGNHFTVACTIVSENEGDIVGRRVLNTIISAMIEGGHNPDLEGNDLNLWVNKETIDNQTGDTTKYDLMGWLFYDSSKSQTRWSSRNDIINLR